MKLLAHGHTAKTIATLEGLSVNVVNERLRSARRKTGAVSSRELARLVGRDEGRAAQENRNKFFGVENTLLSTHRSRRRVSAVGAGSKIVWRAAVIVGVLVAASVAAYLSDSPNLSRPQALLPLPAANGVPAVPEWQILFASDRSPSILYFVPSSEGSAVSIPAVIISCRSVSMEVKVRGFTPHNSWPLPVLTTRIGTAERTGSPEVTASGDRPALGYSFAIADEMLEPLSRGDPISFEFNGASVDMPTIPEPERASFVQRCGALVHPGMRRRGAASLRVY